MAVVAGSSTRWSVHVNVQASTSKAQWHHEKRMMELKSASPDTPTDEELMLAYAAGDKYAFTRIYEKHRYPLYQFVLNACGSEAIGKEIFQDIWMRVVKHRDNYTDASPFGAWLYRIARNRLTDHYRSNARTPQQQELDDSMEASVTEIQRPLQPDEIATINQRKNTLLQAMQTLPAKQREAVLLRHIAGMSLAEVASVVNENTETVKSRLRYATTRLRQQLRATS